jgi:hypothetical protein
VVFARQLDGNLTSLVKKLEEASEKNKEAKLATYVVFCDDAENLDKKLKEFAEKEKLKSTVLMIDNPAVVANQSFKKDELNDKAVEKIIGAIPEILK